MQVEFIKKYVPEDAHLHLIGHSIGAWLVLNLLKNNDIDRRIERCYLLFPTIEYMVETRNGIFFTNFVRFHMFIISVILMIHYNVIILHDTNNYISFLRYPVLHQF